MFKNVFLLLLSQCKLGFILASFSGFLTHLSVAIYEVKKPSCCF